MQLARLVKPPAKRINQPSNRVWRIAGQAFSDASSTRRGGGLDSSIKSQERLLQMVGWNPVPFAQHTLGDGKFLVAVETHFDYESSLLPRAKGVYIVPVDLSQQLTTRNQLR